MPTQLFRRPAAIVLVLVGTVAHGDEGRGAAAPADGPVGWASAEGGTTGGAGGPTVTATDEASLILHAKAEGPLVIRVSGTVRLSEPVRVGSDKTLLGVGADAKLVGGGLRVVKAENVVIRNLSISEAPDAIDVENSRHVWVDHCDLSACKDGLLDVKRGSDLVTVSWTRFHDHRKTCLLGHSDKDDVRRLDSGRLRVTYHHNYFDGTATRHPRVRFTEPVHVFNNSFRGNEYGVASLMDAGVVVEGNHFEDVERPTLTAYGDSPDPGRLVERDNVYVRSGPPQARGAVKEPRDAYPYTLDAAAEVPAIVRRGAGVGKVGGD